MHYINIRITCLSLDSVNKGSPEWYIAKTVLKMIAVFCYVLTYSQAHLMSASRQEQEATVDSMIARPSVL